MKFLFLIITINKKNSLSIAINVNKIKRKVFLYILLLAWTVAKPELILFLLKKESRKCSGYQLLQNKPPQI